MGGASSAEQVFAEHEEAAKAIFAEAGRALRGPEPAGMVYVGFRAQLSRLQVKTAEKLGRKREELMERFGPEEKRLKDMCGV